MAAPTTISRRPIKARESRWAAKVAAALARVPVKPNTISIFSAVFAAIAGACFAATACPRVTCAPSSAIIVAALFICGAACAQLRLLCNLFDGMVAVEGGFKTKSGEVFNELPDRFADAFILIGLGYAASAASSATLGYIAAVLAVITAYVRALGASSGAGQNFMGPMAKQHRMAVVTIAAIVCAAAAFWSWHAHAQVATLALAIMIAGMLVTIVRRARWVIRTLENK